MVWQKAQIIAAPDRKRGTCALPIGTLIWIQRIELPEPYGSRWYVTNCQNHAGQCGILRNRVELLGGEENFTDAPEVRTIL